MFNPLKRPESHDQVKKPRTWIVLRNGGRAVGRCRKPLGGNMLMVPTELELKSILYDQAGAPTPHKDKHRGVEYVALHANRTPKGFTIKEDSEGLLKRRARPTSERRLQHTVSNHRGSPPEGGSGEEEGVSRFLESFAASEMSMEGPLTGNQRAVPPLLSHGRRQARDRRPTSEVTVNTADATLELSQSLAQVDVYGILARAPAVDLGKLSRGVPRGGGDSGSARSSTKKKISGILTRKMGFMMDEQCALKQSPTRDEYPARKTSLGEDTGERNEKTRAYFRRVKQEIDCTERPSRFGSDAPKLPAIIARAEQSLRRTFFQKNSVDASTAKAANSATHADDFIGCRSRCHTRSRCSGRQRWRSIITSKTWRYPSHQSEQIRSSGGVCIRNISTKPIAMAFHRREDSCLPTVRSTDQSESCVVDLNHKTVSDPPAETKENQADGGLVEAVLCERQLGYCGDNEAPGEDPRENIGSSTTAAIPDTTDLIHSDKTKLTSCDSTRNVWLPQEDESALCAREGEAANISDITAALRIEACWRGFIGRCIAKHRLRSCLRDSLQRLGDGKISKVMALTDLRDKERQRLNHALRMATHSRLPLRQLPSQVDLMECRRFVEATRRQRAKRLHERKNKRVQ